jgi:hypothetical protein
MLNHVFVYCIYKLISTIGLSGEDMFDISNISRFNTIQDPILKGKLNVIRSICQLCLSKFIKTMNNNTFDVATAKMKNEALREIGKQDIINRLDKLSDEDRKMALKLQKMNLLEWSDIPEGANVIDDDDDDEVLAGVYGDPIPNAVGKTDEEENDEMNFKGRDGDDLIGSDDEDHSGWKNDDD